MASKIRLSASLRLFKFAQITREMEFESIKEDQAPLDEGNPEKIGAGLLLV